MERRKALTLGLLLGSALLTGLGLALGQQTEVLAKAVRVCLECVGIG